MANLENQTLDTNNRTSMSAVVTKGIKVRFEQVLNGFLDGQLTLTWPDGSVNVYGQRGSSNHNASVRLHGFQPLRRLVTEGQIGFAESYMRGEWESDDLPALFSLIMRNEHRIGPATRGGFLSRLNNMWHHRNKKNSIKGSQRNIAFHYDLGNDFYRLWLDESMSYSSALYEADNESLAQAQQNKINRVINMLCPKSDSTVLEIGCGWGTLARQLALKCDANVTGVSLSAEQLAYADANNRMVADEPGSSEFKHTDYRDVTGKFDHVVSIEMFEAVGQQYWNTYFSKVNALLRDGGTAVIQSITLNEDRFDAYRSRPDFIQRYIFPGGMLPTKTHLKEHLERAGFVLDQQHSFGDSYAKTLKAWRERFEQVSSEVLALNFDERFIRMWRYYLVYCETGFDIGHTDVGLLKIRKA